MIRVYTEIEQGQHWLQQYKNCLPVFACILGFTETGLIPHISAAGATPASRRYTAIADAEFLINGVQSSPTYPLPPLTVGASPVLISRAVTNSFHIPIYLFNAGLPQPPTVPAIDLNGFPAKCVSTGSALALTTVEHLWQQGLIWGEKLAIQAKGSYLIIGECVVGGTTTALALLTALGIKAQGKVNSSHPQCNHQQKWDLVQLGLAQANLDPFFHPINPMQIVASVGDPMQIVAAGMVFAASQRIGVLLAGGTQMLAVYALIRAIKDYFNESINLGQIVVGTTKWVVEDPTGDTIGLVKAIASPSVPLLATQLNFSNSHYANLRAYEQGFVKEGVGAGGCAIASSLIANWTNQELMIAVEQLVADLSRFNP